MGKVVLFGEPPGAITAVRTCPKRAPLSGWVSNDIHRGLCNSFRENDQILTATVSTIFYHLRKAFPLYYLLKHVYFGKSENIER